MTGIIINMTWNDAKLHKIMQNYIKCYKMMQK